jgi:hypothetical protein
MRPGTMTLAVLFLLMRRLYDARTGFIAAVLVLLTPANTGLNLFLTIDAPLLLCWSLALLVFWLAVEKPQCWTRWLALAVVIGLGTLSKQMMLVFPVLMLAFAFVSKEDLKDMKTHLCDLHLIPQKNDIPLYTNPVKELTDEEIVNVWHDYQGEDRRPFVNFARAILRKAQEK